MLKSFLVVMAAIFAVQLSSAQTRQYVRGDMVRLTPQENGDPYPDSASSPSQGTACTLIALPSRSTAFQWRTRGPSTVGPGFLGPGRKCLMDSR